MIAGILVPLGALGLCLYYEVYNYQTLVVLGLIPAILLFILVLKSARSSMVEIKRPLVGNLFMLGLCILVPGLSLCVPGYMILTTEHLEASFVKELSKLVVAPLIGAFVVPWTYYHFKYFQSTVRSKALGVVASLSTFGAVLGCEVYSFYVFWEEFQKDFLSFNEAYCVSLFYTVYTPVFSMVCLGFYSSELRVEDKLLFGGYIFFLVPSLAWVPLYFYFESSTLLMGLLSAPATTLYWSVLALVKENFTESYHYLSSALCLVLVVPLGYLYPMYTVGYVSYSVSYYSLAVSFLALAVFVLVFLCKKAVNFCRLPKTLMKRVFSRMSTKSLTLLISVLGFILGVLVLLYSTISSEKMHWGWGIALGSLILFPFLYFVSNCLLKLKLSENVSENLENLILGLSQSAKESEFYTQKKKKFQIVFAGVFCVGFPTFIILFSLLGEVASNVFLCLSVWLVFIVLLGVGVLEAKARLGSFSGVGTSLLMSCCWCFVFIPFGVMLPAALAVFTEKEDLADVISTFIGFTSLLLMVGVSCFSLVLNFILKKLDQEKKARFCVEELRKALVTIGVRGEPKLLRVMYEQFLYLGTQEYTEVLSQKEVFYWWPVEEDDPDLRFSKSIVDGGTYKKLTNQELEKPQKDNKKSCWEYLGCFSTYPEEAAIVEEVNDSRVFGFSWEELDSFDASNHISQEEFKKQVEFSLQYPNLSEIEQRPINAKAFDYLRTRPEAQLLAESSSVRKEWLKVVFLFFARNKQTIDLENLMDLLRLVRLMPSDYFPKSGVQIMHAKVTHYGAKSIDFEVFAKDLLGSISRVLYPGAPSEIAETKLVTNYLYPNLMICIPKVMRRPRTWEEVYLKSNRKPKLSSEELSSRSIEQVSLNLEEASFPETHNCSDRLYAVFDCIAKKIVGCLEVFVRLFKKLVMICALQSQPKVEHEKEVEEKVTERRQSPEWPEITQFITSTLSKTIQEYQSRNSQVAAVPTRSFTNTVFFCSKALEVFSLTGIAFRKEVGWAYLQQEASSTSEFALVEFSQFKLVFWSAFGLCIAYFLMSIPAIRQVKKGTFGRASDGGPPKKCSTTYWLTKSIVFLGGGLYAGIIKGILAVFACDMSGSTWKLYREDIECFGGEHWLYMCFGLLGMLLYYPVATFMYPNLQFQDLGLDFKFKPGYLVLLSQSKLLVSGVATFFPYETDLELQLIVSLLTQLLILVVSISSRPCIVGYFNIWNSGGFLLSVWILLMALLNTYAQQKELVLIVMCCGSVSILLGAAALHFIYKRRN